MPGIKYYSDAEPIEKLVPPLNNKSISHSKEQENYSITILLYCCSIARAELRAEEKDNPTTKEKLLWLLIHHYQPPLFHTFPYLQRQDRNSQHEKTSCYFRSNDDKP